MGNPELLATLGHPGPQLKRFGDFPFHCVGPLLNGKLKRVAHAAAEQPEEAVPWDVIDESVAAGKGARDEHPAGSSCNPWELSRIKGETGATSG